MILRLSLLALIGAAVQANAALTGSCTPYSGECSQQNYTSCCFFPFVMCLPNTSNATSCLSPLDTASLSPLLSQNPLFAPLSQSFRNASNTFLSLFPNVTEQLSNFPPPFG